VENARSAGISGVSGREPVVVMQSAEDRGGGDARAFGQPIRVPLETPRGL
jgi:hypothetical protein